MITPTQEINRIVEIGASQTSDRAIITHEIQVFHTSREYHHMMAGENYFRGKQDILKARRQVIGEDGKLTTVSNLPNAHIVDNLYRKMVKQKTNYLLGSPVAVDSEDETYTKALQTVFGRNFDRMLHLVCRDSLNCGIGWLYVYYDDSGNIAFKRMKPYEIIPGWTDADHTQLEYVIRVYTVKSYDGRSEQTITKVEYYTLSGIDYYEYSGGTLTAAQPYHEDYISSDGSALNWERLPFIAFKYNDDETSLLDCCKSLQDGINTILSTFQNNMQEDARNTILVLVNYDGEDLGTFRQNLATYGAVKVRSFDGVSGDLKTLQVEVNSENYRLILDLFKKALIENCMGYDAKDDRLSGTPNQMNIQSMYNDIDLDADDMELEFQAALESLLWFVDAYLFNARIGDFSDVPVKFTFNRSMIMNEADLIDNVAKSKGLISDETALAHHPWVDDVQAELERLDAQEAAQMERNDAYDRSLFGSSGADDNGGDVNAE